MSIKCFIFGVVFFHFLIVISIEKAQMKKLDSSKYNFQQRNCENCCIQCTPIPPPCVHQKPPCLVKLPVINYCRKKCPEKCCTCCPNYGKCDNGWNHKFFSC